MARYDYGLRGYRETAPRRRRGGPWNLHPGSEDPRDAGYGPHGLGRGGERPPEYHPVGYRVTTRYNHDYVRPEGDRYPVNYDPYAGDSRWRIGDYTRFEHPALSIGLARAEGRT